MVTSTPRGDVTSRSPFAPFRHRAFFWLWLGVVISSVGTWGQTVGAQWLFVNDPNAATIVPLVQTASHPADDAAWRCPLGCWPTRSTGGG